MKSVDIDCTVTSIVVSMGDDDDLAVLITVSVVIR